MIWTIEPGLNVRLMGIDERAVLRYLVSAYSSLVALVPDAFGVLAEVQLGRAEELGPPG